MNASFDCDVLVIGGGAAGLNASRTLAAAGQDVLLVEARGRLGGRVHSFVDPLVPIPVELGAEFVHGRPTATFDLLDRYGLVAYAGAQDHWRHHDGRLCRLEEFEESMRPVTDLMREHFARGGGDLTLDDFLRTIAEPRADLVPDARRWHAAIAMTRSFFQGFDAVDPRDASARALAEGLEGVGDVGDDPQYRLREGYGALVAALATEVRAAGARVVLGTRVRRFAWSADGVEATTDAGLIRARRCVVTLPVGLLVDGSNVSFDPELPAKRAAANQLGTGPVVKVVLAFRKVFWEDAAFARRAMVKGESADLSDLAMWHMPGSAWPTWWTYHPLRVPVVTGWAAGPAALALTGRGEAALLDSALLALAASLNADAGELSDLLEVAHVHDWPADEFARGAYSYLRVGGEGARAALAEPVEKTLFFAGEATDTKGQASTVAGALASGERAAREVLAVSRQSSRSG